MKIYDGCTVREAYAIAYGLGIEFQGKDASNSRGVRISGRLVAHRELANPYPARKRDRRMPHCVCWHGYRDFMRAVFERYPDARIVTGLRGKVEYRGLEDFRRNYASTGNFNVGSIVQPLRMISACECSESGGEDAAHLDWHGANPFAEYRRSNPPLDTLRAITARNVANGGAIYAEGN